MTFDLPVTHPDFGRAQPCPVCGHKLQAEFLRRISGLTREMESWRFETSKRTRWNSEAFDAARAVARSPRWFLTLTGPPGVGKTHLMACVVNAGRDAGWRSVYITMAQLLDHLRRAYAPEARVKADVLWDKLVSCKILCLDEVDRFNPTPWAMEKLFELIDHRYRHGNEMATVFASNASIDTLPEYIQSRMSDGRCRAIAFEGPDARRMKR